MKPEEVTDIILSHAHWDHAEGADLFPKAQVWIQKEEYRYYTADAWQPDGKHGGIEPDDMAYLAAREHGRAVAPRRRRPRDPARHSRLHRRPAHVRVAVRERDAKPGRSCWRRTTCTSTRISTSTLPIAQTFDAASNLAAQDRMKTLVKDPRFIIPGHDPAVLTRFPKVVDGIVRIE